MIWTISESQFIFQTYSQIMLVPNSSNFSGSALRALVPNSIFPNNIFKTQDYLGIPNSIFETLDYLGIPNSIFKTQAYLGIPNSHKIFKKLFGTKNYLGKWLKNYLGSQFLRGVNNLISPVVEVADSSLSPRLLFLNLKLFLKIFIFWWRKPRPNKIAFELNKVNLVGILAQRLGRGVLQSREIR